jgi:hypothetical protein
LRSVAALHGEFRAGNSPGHAMGVMAAYHEIDGIPFASDPELLNSILREGWGFKRMTSFVDPDRFDRCLRSALRDSNLNLGSVVECASSSLLLIPPSAKVIAEIRVESLPG